MYKMNKTFVSLNTNLQQRIMNAEKIRKQISRGKNDTLIWTMGHLAKELD